MSTLGGPKVVNQGMGLMLDPSNPKIVPSAKNTNLLDYSTWVVGNTSATGFSRNGGSDENIIEAGTGPWGEAATIWSAKNNTASSNSDGGWNASFTTIDNSYMYRFSVWCIRPVTGDGRFYLGTQGRQSDGSQTGLNYRQNIAGSTTNPYFWVTNTTGGGLSTTEWRLIVGHVWPYGTGQGSNHADSGIYNVNGKTGSISNDYVWKSNTAKTYHRTYLYYSTDSTTVQQWAYPRIDKIDGTEPSINELLAGGSQSITNPVNRSQKFYMRNNLRLKSIKNWGRSRSINTFDFDGTNDIIETQGSTSTSTKRTIEVVFKVNSMQGSYMPIAAYTRGGNQSTVSYKRIWLGIQSNKFQMHGWGTTDPASSTSVTNGDYYHAVYSYDQSTKKHQIWINGVLENSSTNNQTGMTGWTNSSDHKWFVGGDPDAAQWTASASTHFNGEVAVFRTYNRILSSTEVKINYGSLKIKYDLG